MNREKVLHLKTCPRCGGDVHSSRDVYGPYRECLQCGYMVDLERSNPLADVAVPRAKKKVA